jgi:hypothetical protein
MGRILQLGPLARDGAEWEAGAKLSLPGLMEGVPVVWGEQRRVAGLASKGA